MLTGGCCCGAVRYEADGEPFDLCICHCEICRRTTGAPAVAWFTVRPEDLRLTKGEPARFASSATGSRQFCSTCGTQITFRDKRIPDEIDVTTASLDDPAAAPPVEHIWTRSRLPWMADLDRLPEHTMEDRR